MIDSDNQKDQTMSVEARRLIGGYENGFGPRFYQYAYNGGIELGWVSRCDDVCQERVAISYGWFFLD